jgi:hypothetical protein
MNHVGPPNTAACHPAADREHHERLHVDRCLAPREAAGIAGDRTLAVEVQRVRHLRAHRRAARLRRDADVDADCETTPDAHAGARVESRERARAVARVDLARLSELNRPHQIGEARRWLVEAADRDVAVVGPCGRLRDGRRGVQQRDDERDRWCRLHRLLLLIAARASSAR